MRWPVCGPRPDGAMSAVRRVCFLCHRAPRRSLRLSSNGPRVCRPRVNRAAVRAWAGSEVTSWWNRRASPRMASAPGRVSSLSTRLADRTAPGGERGDAPREPGHERVQFGVGQGPVDPAVPFSHLGAEVVRAKNRLHGPAPAQQLSSPVRAGVYTLRYRQSSLNGPGGANGPGGCGQLGPNWVASRTPCHPAGGCGGRHRRLPTGGRRRECRETHSRCPRSCRGRARRWWTRPGSRPSPQLRSRSRPWRR
jgi:hypothetical protein